MEALPAAPAVKELGYTGEMKILEPGEKKSKAESKSYEEWMMRRDWGNILKPTLLAV